jgi:hypothetical protein
MSGVLHDVAAAALPVAIGLVALAATARGLIAVELDHAPAQRLAAQYLDALGIWALAAVATHVLALGLAGELGLGSLIVPVALGVAAVLLRTTAGEPVAAATPVAQTPPPTPTADAPTPAPAHSLWVDTRDDDTTPRAGLWSRA